MRNLEMSAEKLIVQFNFGQGLTLTNEQLPERSPAWPKRELPLLPDPVLFIEDDCRSEQRATMHQDRQLPMAPTSRAQSCR